jgi:flagellar hook-length control protein FliK
MTTQIINVPVIDKANTGSLEPVQPNSKKSAHKEGAEPGDSSHSLEGGASGDLRSPTARFGETLKKKIAQDQGAVQMDGTPMSHKTGGELLKAPFQGLVPENPEPGQGQASTGPLGQGINKSLQDKKHVKGQVAILPSGTMKAEDLLANAGSPPQTQAKTGVASGAKIKGVKAAELEHGTPDLMPMEADVDLGVIPSQKGSDVLQVGPTSPVPGPAKLRPDIDSKPEIDPKVVLPDTTLMPQRAVSQTLRSPEGANPPQLAQPGSEPARVQEISGPVAAQDVLKPVEIESMTGAVTAQGVSNPANNQSMTGTVTAQGVAASSQVQDTEVMALSGETPGIRQATAAQKLVNPSSSSTQAQEGEAKLQLQSIPENQGGSRVDQQTASALQRSPVAQSPEQKQPNTNASHSPRPASADVFQDAGQNSGLKTLKQENAGVSGLAADQRHETASALSSGQVSDLQRFTKGTTKPQSVKVQSVPPQGGVTASKTPAAMLPNESQVNPVDHTVSGNSQVSVLETDVSNPTGVKPFSLFDGTTVLKDTSSSVSGQILESIHSSLQQGQNRLTIALNPPELGRVLVRFEEQDNQIIGVLEVSQRQTRAEIEQALPQLLQSLPDSGVKVKRLDVMLNDQPGQGHTKHQAWNDSSGPNSEQQNQQERDNRQGTNTGTGYDRQGSEAKRSDAYEPEGSMLSGNNAINMLA